MSADIKLAEDPTVSERVPLGLDRGMEIHRIYTSDPSRRAEGQERSDAAAVIEWLMREGRCCKGEAELLDALCWRLYAAGLPVGRATLHIGTLHPQYAATGCRWVRQQGATYELLVQHGVRTSPIYLASPMRPIFEEGARIRRRIEGDEAVLDFPILTDLKQQGYTDYVALPLQFSNGRIQACTFASDRPGGFADCDIEVLEALLLPLASVLEIFVLRGMMANVLNVYLGHKAGRQVLAGDIKRGEGQTIRAVIWQADLRNFTRMSDRLPGDEVIAILNAYFERMVRPVEAIGGEVLKFIGDGLLAIVPIEECANRKEACDKALAAAEQALANMDALNVERVAAGDEPLGLSITLHLGEVIFGNIGAPDRLDFTVIGPAVNLAFRIDHLAKVLDRRLLLSDDFAQAAERPLQSLGFHALRGIREPHEIFTLP